MAPGARDPAQFLGIRLPVTFETCEVIEERWANWMRHNPVVAVETQREHLRRLKALLHGGAKGADYIGDYHDNSGIAMPHRRRVYPLGVDNRKVPEPLLIEIDIASFAFGST